MTARRPPSLRDPENYGQRLAHGLRAMSKGSDGGRVLNASPISWSDPADAPDLDLSPAGDATSETAAQRDRFPASGTLAGTETALSLTAVPLSGSLHLYLNGIEQDEGIDYTLSGSTVTILTAMGIASGDVIDTRYLDTGVTVAGVAGTVLFRWNFDVAPNTTATPAWTVANGTFAVGSARHGATGVVWQSDCHAHKTLTAQSTLACGYAIRNTATTAPYNWFGPDTDADDFGIMSFCGDAGATCHIYLDWSGNYIQARRGQRGTVIATASSPMPTTTVGQWVYLVAEVTVNDTTGTVKVWMDGTLVINFTGDTRNGGTSTSPDTVKIGGFYATDVGMDDLYIATGYLGDPGDVTDLVIG